MGQIPFWANYIVENNRLSNSPFYCSSYATALSFQKRWKGEIIRVGFVSGAGI